MLLTKRRSIGVLLHARTARRSVGFSPRRGSSFEKSNFDRRGSSSCLCGIGPASRPPAASLRRRRLKVKRIQPLCGAAKGSASSIRRYGLINAATQNSTGFAHRRFNGLCKSCSIGMCPGLGTRSVMRGFLADRRGNYALMTVVAMVPLMGGLALAVDYSEMNRQKQAVNNALDAAGIATARQVVTGASESELIAYAKTFFEANLGSVEPGRHAAYRHAARQPGRRRHLEALRQAQLQAALLSGLRRTDGQAGRGRQCRHKLRRRIPRSA